MLEAVFNPSHRAMDMHRHPCNRHFLRMKDVLVAEPSSDIRRDYPDAPLLKAETFRETGTHEELVSRGGIYQRLHELQFEDAVVDL